VLSKLDVLKTHDKREVQMQTERAYEINEVFRGFPARADSRKSQSLAKI
jgi:hypothetical protein